MPAIVIEGLALDDVLLMPQHSTASSRFDPAQISLSTKLTPTLSLELPIITSNMDTVTNSAVAIEANKVGALGIVHRFQEPEEHKLELQRMFEIPKVACIGVGESSKRRLETLLKTTEGSRDTVHVQDVLVDIAHGDSIVMVEMIRWIRTQYPDLNIIAGNVATGSGAKRLAEAGANCIKVGVGPGSVCTTRINTGCGVPQFTAICEVADVLYYHNRNCEIEPVTMIADGGIKNSGDIAKCLAAGANAVMVGSLIAGAFETPGERFVGRDGIQYKLYRGMASQAAQKSWKGTVTSVEGESTSVPLKPPVREILSYLESGIRSAMSYQGARTLAELQDGPVFYKQTSNGLRESQAHGIR